MMPYGSAARAVRFAPRRAAVPGVIGTEPPRAQAIARTGAACASAQSVAQLARMLERSRGTTVWLPAGAWSRRACRTGRSSAVMGTMCSEWTKWAAVRGLRSRIMSPQRISTGRSRHRTAPATSPHAPQGVLPLGLGSMGIEWNLRRKWQDSWLRMKATARPFPMASPTRRHRRQRSGPQAAVSKQDELRKGDG